MKNIMRKSLILYACTTCLLFTNSFGERPNPDEHLDQMVELLANSYEEEYWDTKPTTIEDADRLRTKYVDIIKEKLSLLAIDFVQKGPTKGNFYLMMFDAMANERERHILRVLKK